MLLALKAINGPGYLVSWVTVHLVVSCLSCTNLNLLLHVQRTSPETRVLMSMMDAWVIFVSFVTVYSGMAE